MENKNTVIDYKEILTIPNLITAARILLIAPFVISFLNEDYSFALIILGISGLTDCFDGLIARKLNQVTELGKMLDPVADKLTLLAVAVCICAEFHILIPLMAILVLKDTLMIIGGVYLVKIGTAPPAAKWYGKVATVLFYFSACIIVFLKAVFGLDIDLLNLILMAVTAGAMLYALIRYIQLFLKIKDENKNKNQSKTQN